MIKFFRHIRKSLLMENKTSKYFKYAIGEIVLVVIGILIALQINNWNENRKSRQKEQSYLLGFKSDIQNSLKELDRVINKSEMASMAADSILKMKRGEIDTLNLSNFVRCVLKANGYTAYIVQQGTIDDIKGSGNLDVIKNDSIRLAIVSWDANLNSIREWEELGKNSSNDLADYLRVHMDNYKLANPHKMDMPITLEEQKLLMEDRLFLNIISDRVRLPKRLNIQYVNEVKKLNGLIRKIDNHLKIF